MQRALPLLLSALTAASLVCTGCTSSATRTSEKASDDSTDSGTTAVFFGDSYTAASEGGGGYALRAAVALDWTPVLVAVGGTGYVAPGPMPEGGPFGVRLQQVVAADPDVVVVQGSTNDVGSPVADVGAAARTLYSRLQQRLPDAEIVVVGPLSPPGVDQLGVRAVRDVLAKAADDAGVPFIDPIADSWLVPADGLYADPIHPDEVGYTELARDLVQALRHEGF